MSSVDQTVRAHNKSIVIARICFFILSPFYYYRRNVTAETTKSTLPSSSVGIITEWFFTVDVLVHLHGLYTGWHVDVIGTNNNHLINIVLLTFLSSRIR